MLGRLVRDTLSMNPVEEVVRVTKTDVSAVV